MLGNKCLYDFWSVSVWFVHPFYKLRKGVTNGKRLKNPLLGIFPWLQTWAWTRNFSAMWHVPLKDEVSTEEYTQRRESRDKDAGRTQMMVDTLKMVVSMAFEETTLTKARRQEGHSVRIDLPILIVAERFNVTQLRDVDGEICGGSQTMSKSIT